MHTLRSITAVAVLTIASVTTSSAWAVEAQPAFGSSIAQGSYTTIVGSKQSSGSEYEMDNGAYVEASGSKFGNGFSVSAEASSGTLKALAATTYSTANVSAASSGSYAVASYTDFVTFSGGSGYSEGVALASLSGFLSGGRIGNAGY